MSHPTSGRPVQPPRSQLQAQNPLAQLQNPALLQSANVAEAHLPGTKHTFAVYNPATAAVLAHVRDMGAADAEQAIARAHAALPAWRELTPKARAEVLHKWFVLLNQHVDDLARIMTAEQGKPLAEAQVEAKSAASFVQWYAEEAKRVYGEVLSPAMRGHRMLVLKQAIGVCAAITPWNFPLAMITRKVAPALAAGCTVVIKPAELTPLSCLAAMALAHQAGVPREALQVLTTTDAQGVGAVLCASPIVRHLSFTGSTEVGRVLMAQCAPTIKKLALELGGNAPFIVFDDADLNSAVQGAVQSKFRNTGQTCICSNRIYVQQGIYPAFVEAFAAEVSKLQVGDGFTPGAQIGPLIASAAVQKVAQHVQDAVDKGARVVTGGKPLPELGPLFYAPTVLADCTQAMQSAREEVFGPVAPVLAFASEAEAIALANSTEFGLAAYFYARDIGRIWRVSEALESGMVGVNTGLITFPHTPFGGIKQSGLGKEGGHQGLSEYLVEKLVAMGDL